MPTTCDFTALCQSPQFSHLFNEEDTSIFKVELIADDIIVPPGELDHLLNAIGLPPGEKLRISQENSRPGFTLMSLSFATSGADSYILRFYDSQRTEIPDSALVSHWYFSLLKAAFGLYFCLLYTPTSCSSFI